MIYYLESWDGEVIVNNLASSCNGCLNQTSTLSIKETCTIDKKSKRLGMLKNHKGKGFICCGETKTTKLFREKLENLVYAIPEFKKIKSDIIKEISSTESQRFKRVAHNLKSLNGHSIQELYNLVPQEILTANIDKQIDTIKTEIAKDPDQAAMTFLKMVKHNSHMKVEFSIYDKLFKDNPALNFREHAIRKVIMNVLHTFFIDFNENGIIVAVNENYTKILIDYESIHVALYHIIENATKYIKPKSRLQIRFIENESNLRVLFEMESLHIETSELESIFNEGYSGIHARNAKKEGEGIGMYRVKRLIELNDAIINIHPGKEKNLYQGLHYSRNIFELIFKK